MQDEEKVQFFSRYRGYLRLLAESQTGKKYAKRFDASDIAQETLLKAWRDRDQFRGTSGEEVRAWLTVILAHTVANATRDHRRMRRDVEREREIEEDLSNSSQRLFDWRGEERHSPSRELRRLELLGLVADALEHLPEGQREAVVLRHWTGLPLEEIASRMEKTPGAVAVLIHRGLTRLRDRLKEKGAD